ncbi:hypothetical protein BJ912DRAFT_1041256 [Pholiota molesta]|nr:hypothetical protein BJ912DRAFT_1041256 [Pholiota molesta]
MALFLHVIALVPAAYSTVTRVVRCAILESWFTHSVARLLSPYLLEIAPCTFALKSAARLASVSTLSAVPHNARALAAHELELSFAHTEYADICGRVRAQRDSDLDRGRIHKLPNARHPAYELPPLRRTIRPDPSLTSLPLSLLSQPPNSVRLLIGRLRWMGSAPKVPGGAAV